MLININEVGVECLTREFTISDKVVLLLYFNMSKRKLIVPLKITFMLCNVLGKWDTCPWDESFKVDRISLITSLTSVSCVSIEFLDLKAEDACNICNYKIKLYHSTIPCLRNFDIVLKDSQRHQESSILIWSNTL